MPLIILDFDETYTALPEVFDVFVRAAHKRADTVVLICTARHDRSHDDNSDIEQVADKLLLDVIYAGHRSKWEAVRRAGYMPENAIWIDDTPRAIEGLSWD